MKNLHRILHVYIYNSVEDEWSYISGITSKKLQRETIHSSDKYADCYMYTGANLDEFVFISPVAVSGEFISYFENLSQTKVTVLTPKKRTNFISLNITHDRKILQKLKTLAQSYESVSLSAYANTPHIYKVATTLKRLGFTVIMPHSPQERDIGMVKPYGSKAGFRTLVEKLHINNPSLLIPEGYIFKSRLKAAEKASQMYEKFQSIVVKTNRGCAGYGVHIFRKGKLPANKTERIKQLRELFNKNNYWKKNPIVVEKFIPINPKNSSCFPSLEYYIDQKGRTHMYYYCNMIVTPEGEFYGMEMNKDSVAKKIRTNFLKVTRLIAQEFASSGYRGHLDIDTIYGADKKLYVNESNLRQNGGTDVYRITKKLIGAKFFSKAFVISRYRDLPATFDHSFQAVYHKLEPILFSQKTKTGIIISSESVIRNHGLSYAVIGKNKKNAIALERSLNRILDR
ncbi:hypothetical protein COY90_01460 [Candidatus Roizmanbacteria bacterium CG_4_10_14_0_8_um_filter_39_9]|uniref:ATP-grasp domain-containing protein n=1 Tax=Candidatus Roizmanbacteria bacterium CG_4_10_14_0_8_um_filter_39_9 TaxID=1974829 RepID=A0A2M7QEM3_9BACT|nr:MAG: hypothetical protein COY90_01460 [Candidatus Roizmanbacteria bacterium CG_4_10_14_0_8_um_filter_39_9]